MALVLEVDRISVGILLVRGQELGAGGCRMLDFLAIPDRFRFSCESQTRHCFLEPGFSRRRREGLSLMDQCSVTLQSMGKERSGLLANSGSGVLFSAGISAIPV